MVEATTLSFRGTVCGFTWRNPTAKHLPLERDATSTAEISLEKAYLPNHSTLVKAFDRIKMSVRRVLLRLSAQLTRWKEESVEGLHPRFGGGRPPKLAPIQWTNICTTLEEGQPWTPREIHALIEDRYDVTYHPTHLARKLRESGMHYAKPRPMDPRSPADAEEILTGRLDQALGEENRDSSEEEDDPVVFGFFDKAWP